MTFHFIYETAGYEKPMRRLWISSMEDRAAKTGLVSLKGGQEYDILFASALCRTKTDWLIGISATRPFFCLYGRTLNVEYIQTPALKILIDRDVAISHFQKEKYYHVRFNLSSVEAANGRTSDRAGAGALEGTCETKTAVCVSLTREKKTATPPKLFDLTSLQQEANRIFGHTTKQTLDLAQSLYEKRLLTYPRADSSLLTDDIGGTAADIIALLCGKLPFMAGADFTPEVVEILNSKKVSDRHAIIPIMELAKADPDVLPESEKNILILAEARLLFVTAEPHIYEAVTTAFSCAGTDFTTKGKTVLAEGWKELQRRYQVMLKDKPEAKSGENADVMPPKLSEGQGLPNPAAKVTEHTATPSRPHSEASLLSAMERARNGDTDPDAERRELGTPATHVAVIEKLAKGSFMERKGKQFTPTKNGNGLIRILPDILTSSQLTTEWENGLTQITRGTADPGESLSDIEAMVRESVQIYAVALDGEGDLFREEKPSVGKCPRCGSPVHEGKKNYYCNNKERAFIMRKNGRFFEEYKAVFSVKIAAVPPKFGEANVKKLYSPKTDKTYNGTIVLVDTGGKYTNYRIEMQKS